MNFGLLRRSVELYVHLEGTKQRKLIEDFINDSVLEFLRLDEWNKCIKTDVISLDDSNVYDLTDMQNILSNVFHAEVELVDENDQTYYKVDYKTYIKSADKRYLWAIEGTNLYITGTATDINFVYKTPGEIHPLIKPSQENLVLQYYSDIIKRMAVIKCYDWIGEDEMVKKEEANLQRAVTALYKEENRINKLGKLHYVSRA